MVNIATNLAVLKVWLASLLSVFARPKNPCGGKEKFLKLGRYIVLMWYYICTKDELPTNTTTY